MGPSKTIGIVAGGGSLPLEVARSVTSRGDSVHVILVDGAADEALKAFPHTIVNWAEFGRAARALEAAHVRDVVFLGKYTRPNLSTARPNVDLVFAIPKLLRILRAGGDDAVLRGLLALFEDRGFRIVGAGEVAPELLVGEGVLTRAKPDTRDAADILKGFAVVAALGRHDIGQGVVVSGGVIEAIEGAEGTDQMLVRVAERRVAGVSQKRGVLVKRPKPGQDLRVDLPAIGPGTARNAQAAGLSGIAVQSGQVLAAGRAMMIGVADQAGLFVAGVHEARANATARRSAKLERRIIMHGPLTASAADKADAARGAAILEDLSVFAAGTALVMRDRRVLAIGASEPASAVITRIAALTLRTRKRRGVAVIHASETIDQALMQAVLGAQLAGVAVVSLSGDEAGKSAVAHAGMAGALGLFYATVVEQTGQRHD